MARRPNVLVLGVSSVVTEMLDNPNAHVSVNCDSPEYCRITKDFLRLQPARELAHHMWCVGPDVKVRDWSVMGGITVDVVLFDWTLSFPTVQEVNTAVCLIREGGNLHPKSMVRDAVEWISSLVNRHLLSKNAKVILPCVDPTVFHNFAELGASRSQQLEFDLSSVSAFAKSVETTVRDPLLRALLAPRRRNVSDQCQEWLTAETMLALCAMSGYWGCVLLVLWEHDSDDTDVIWMHDLPSSNGEVDDIYVMDSDTVDPDDATMVRSSDDEDTELDTPRTNQVATSRRIVSGGIEKPMPSRRPDNVPQLNLNKLNDVWQWNGILHQSKGKRISINEEAPECNLSKGDCVVLREIIKWCMNQRSTGWTVALGFSDGVPQDDWYVHMAVIPGSPELIKWAVGQDGEQYQIAKDEPDSGRRWITNLCKAILWNPDDHFNCDKPIVRELRARFGSTDLVKLVRWSQHPRLRDWKVSKGKYIVRAVRPMSGS